MTTRLDDLQRFYTLLADLEQRLEGKRLLRDCHGRLGWPEQGVYFFFEEGEQRQESGDGLRVVRVGTHGVSKGSKAKLWTRLRQHRGSDSGSGNHRGSIFRLIVGAALRARDGLDLPSWGVGSGATAAAKRFDLSDGKDVKRLEADHESAVSTYIGAMPFLWLEVCDASGKDSTRSYIERNSIALLSNYDKPANDAASPSWLGLHSVERSLIRDSGLWNNRHVKDAHDSDFLDVVEAHVMTIGS